jgi:hypothetical protein
VIGSWHITPPLLTLAIDGGERSTSRHGRFTSVKQTPVPMD